MSQEKYNYYVDLETEDDKLFEALVEKSKTQLEEITVANATLREKTFIVTLFFLSLLTFVGASVSIDQTITTQATAFIICFIAATRFLNKDMEYRSTMDKQVPAIKKRDQEIRVLTQELKLEGIEPHVKRKKRKNSSSKVTLRKAKQRAERVVALDRKHFITEIEELTYWVSKFNDELTLFKLKKEILGNPNQVDSDQADLPAIASNSVTDSSAKSSRM